MKQYSIGIDIGSTCAKAVVMDSNNDIVDRRLLPTGWSSVDTAHNLEEQLSAYIRDASVVATGYGRVCVPYADRKVTEITCHGKGAAWLYGGTAATVIDIGGQDTKIIRLENNQVTDFLMNDKCSAGTGRFLEVMAATLGVDPETLCRLAAQGKGVSISSMCTVFAESEVISLIGRGEKRENIAFAVVNSIVTKVVSQASRLLAEEGIVCLTGGLCSYDYLRSCLSATLHRDVVTSEDGRYAGAIGAALLAERKK